MLTELSDTPNGRVHSYRFEKWERKIISDALVPVALKFNRRIEALKKSAKSKKQSTCPLQIKKLQKKLGMLNHIIYTLGKDCN